jgi:hypothetical protein
LAGGRKTRGLPVHHAQHPYTAEFEAFWQEYPRKVGKKQALKAWQAALKDAAAEAIIAGAVRLAADPNRVPQFTPHPATWLNRGGWDDEPLPARGDTRKTGGERRMDQYATLYGKVAGNERKGISA